MCFSVGATKSSVLKAHERGPRTFCQLSVVMVPPQDNHRAHSHANLLFSQRSGVRSRDMQIHERSSPRESRGANFRDGQVAGTLAVRATASDHDWVPRLQSVCNSRHDRVAEHSLIYYAQDMHRVKTKETTRSENDGIIWAWPFFGNHLRSHRRKHVNGRRITEQDCIPRYSTRWFLTDNVPGCATASGPIRLPACHQVYKYIRNQSTSTTATTRVRRRLQVKPGAKLQCRLRCRPYPPRKRKCASAPDRFL